MTQPTNADLLARVEDHEKRIRRLEPLLELALATHEAVRLLRDDITLIKHNLQGYDEAIVGAIREGTREIAEGARAAVKAEVQSVLRAIDCLACAKRDDPSEERAGGG